MNERCSDRQNAAGRRTGGGYPLQGGSSIQPAPHEHKWVFLRTEAKKLRTEAKKYFPRPSGPAFIYLGAVPRRVAEVFFCEGCLQIKEVER